MASGQAAGAPAAGVVLEAFGHAAAFASSAGVASATAPIRPATAVVPSGIRGQAPLAARTPRRREPIGIVDRRLSESARLGAEMRYNAHAGADDVLALEPDAVFVATGGVPDTEVLEAGDESVVSGWDVVGGGVAAAGRVLVYDDNGNHPGMQGVEVLAEAGAEVGSGTPERGVAPEIGGPNHAAYARVFQRRGVRVSVDARSLAVRRAGDELVAVLGSGCGDRREERRVDQGVVEHGTLPLDGLCEALKPGSRDAGEVDRRARPGGSLPTVPHRRRGGEPRHPRRGVRRAAAGEGFVAAPTPPHAPAAVLARARHGRADRLSPGPGRVRGVGGHRRDRVRDGGTGCGPAVSACRVVGGGAGVKRRFSPRASGDAGRAAGEPGV